MSLTAAQLRALTIARSQANVVFAGTGNAGWRRTPIPANVLRVLERPGLLKLGKTSVGELYGMLTAAGAAFIDALTPSG